MRYEPEHKTRTRDRIVRNAARKLRAEGLSGSGVASVMKASGLTVGGFYKHFRSKDELLSDALAQAFSDSEKVYSSLQSVPREERWKEVVRLYLSPEHCDRPDTGCPVAALAPEMSRAKLGVRKRIAGLIKERTDRWAEFMPGATAIKAECCCQAISKKRQGGAGLLVLQILQLRTRSALTQNDADHRSS